MKFSFRLSRNQTVGLAILVLFSVGLACSTGGNISPSNPQLQEPLVVEGLAFINYLQQIGQLQPENIAPWIVKPSPPPFGGGIITFEGWGPTQENLKSKDVPIIALHEILPNGCGDYRLGREIGSTTMHGNSNNWIIPNILIFYDTDAIVGAIVKSDGREGPVSNLLNFNSYAMDVSIKKPGPNEQFMAKVDFEGSAVPGQCLELWRGDQLAGKPTAVEKDGSWKIPSVRVFPGENIFTLKVRLPGKSADYSITAQHLH